MVKKNLFIAFSILMVFSMLLAACAAPATTTTVEKTVVVEKVVTQEVVKTVEVTQQVEVVKEVMVTPEPVARKGAWVDNVVFTSIDQADQAVAQIKSGDIDIYAYSVSDAELFKTVTADPNLTYSNSLGSYTELTFNPAGPVFPTTGKLNPFAVPAVREAMNWLIDRNSVVQNIYGGLAKVKVFPLNSAFADYVRYVAKARELEAYYAYNPEKAKQVISDEMVKMGAALGADGKWMFNDEPVTIIILIRVEDQRKATGDYVANQLESIGFTVDRQYKTRTEASPIWNRGNPDDGLFHIYTGGWITTAISRDDGTNFAYFYTPLGSGSPLWQAYKNDPAYHNENNDGVADKLWNNVFGSMEERGQLFEQAMELALKDSIRVWIIDQLSYSPFSAKVQTSYDLAGGISGTQLWPFTVRFVDQEGGTVKIAQPGILVEPWNPVAGSNWIYDTMPRRATEDYGALADPYTGLAWPQRLEKMDVTVETGLPIAKTLDWLTLTTADTIEVPADAWVDWDAAAQKFITAGEKFTSTVTSKTKTVLTYPADLFTTVKWHDGSNLSAADFVMNIIMTFDRAKPESAIYDEAAVPAFDSFMSVFKGIKIVSTDPLVIEYYTDSYSLDAETQTSGASYWWPQYGFGQAPWQTVALGYLAESEKKATFSTDKAGALSTENAAVEWMSFIAGPSLQILSGELVTATAQSFIPYAPTMGAYVTADEAAARYKNTHTWYQEQGHFWIGTGPFFLNKVFPVEQTLTLARFADYPDTANKWSRFGTPMVAEVEVDGAAQVKIGAEAKFDLMITFQGADYPADQIDAVKYLLFDSKGALVATGAATNDNGAYSVVLPADVTSKLEAGSNKLEVAVTSKAVSIPTFASFEFVTAP